MIHCIVFGRGSERSRQWSSHSVGPSWTSNGRFDISFATSSWGFAIMGWSIVEQTGQQNRAPEISIVLRGSQFVELNFQPCSFGWTLRIADDSFSLIRFPWSRGSLIFARTLISSNIFDEIFDIAWFKNRKTSLIFRPRIYGNLEIVEMHTTRKSIWNIQSTVSM